jgi:hypothetical protein
MEADIVVQDELHYIRSLHITADHLVENYDPWFPLTMDQHYGIQLRAHLLYHYHKLVHYLKTEYRVPEDYASAYINEYIGSRYKIYTNLNNDRYNNIKIR